ncbi:MAG: hypothetical protein UZ16_OP3001000648 [Candidatus Hinthialibacteria bacterium OLB16]|nr:MAG: hypothetical protein UZ16_OP3001000648 [Candidatus Hinthialibacteria bacterium OLB16]
MVLATILGLAVFGRAFGPYWDSWYYFHHAEPFSRWLASWWTGESVPPLSDFRAYFPEEDMHPPLMVYGAGFFHAFFHPLLGHLGSCRLIIICFSALWCGAFLSLSPKPCGRDARSEWVGIACGLPALLGSCGSSEHRWAGGLDLRAGFAFLPAVGPRLAGKGSDLVHSHSGISHKTSVLLSDPDPGGVGSGVQLEGPLR